MKKVYDLINDPKNAKELIDELNGADIVRLAELVLAPNDTWSTQQKIALVKKDVRAFSHFPFLSNSLTMNDQELLKECLKAFNKKFTPVERKDVYYFDFKMVFRHITFNQENLETLVKSFPDQSPFIFEEFPFNEIQNWRELIKSNPNLALQNRMLEAMDEVNYFSKSDLQKFIEKYDDLLRNKTFYNHCMEKASIEIQNKIRDKNRQVGYAISDAYSSSYEKGKAAEEKYGSELDKVQDALDYITKIFDPYKRYIMEQELAKQQKAGSGVTA